MSNTIFNNITLTKKLPLKNKIIMYSGNDLPDGYVWCDGEHGTPNLKDRFIYGINETGNTGDFGNSEINSIPKHNHSITATKQGGNSDSTTINYTDIQYQKINDGGLVENHQGDGQRGNGVDILQKEHSHGIDNNTRNLGQTLNLQINASNNNTNTEYNNIQNTGVNNNEFIQRYIYIGFIMKYP